MGRIRGYLNTMPDDETGRALDPTDSDAPDAPHRLMVDGHGEALQAMVVVPDTEITVDLAGRRVTLQKTLAELREIPHRDFDDKDAAPLNARA